MYVNNVLELSRLVNYGNLPCVVCVVLTGFNWIDLAVRTYHHKKLTWVVYLTCRLV